MYEQKKLEKSEITIPLLDAESRLSLNKKSYDAWVYFRGAGFSPKQFDS